MIKVEDVIALQAPGLTAVSVAYVLGMLVLLHSIVIPVVVWLSMAFF